MAGAVKVLLECIGEDPSRGGLLDTPMRVAKALTFMTKGYQQTAQGMPYAATLDLLTDGTQR